MVLKVIILAGFKFDSLSGGYRRLYNILKLGKSENIEYVVITDARSRHNAAKMFADFATVLRQYKVYSYQKNTKKTAVLRLKQLSGLGEIIDYALFISKVSETENADLIVSPSEAIEEVLPCFLASKLCGKPWTAIFQPTTDLLQPSNSIRALNPINILWHINQKISTQDVSLRSKLGLALGLMFLLKTAERAIILTVSTSVVEDFYLLDPNIKFITIAPGNGIDLNKFSAEQSKDFHYHAVFFARLAPEKGIFDLVEIWKAVIKCMPHARLAVCGITQDKEITNKLLKSFLAQNLQRNIEFLGQQEEDKLRDTIKHSYLTLNPSYVDSFSLITLESLACGTPVVAYDIPAIKHNFGGCEAVFRCSVGDKISMANKILDVISNGNRSELSVIARKFAVGHDWTCVVKAEKQAYAQLIGQ